MHRAPSATAATISGPDGLFFSLAGNASANIGSSTAEVFTDDSQSLTIASSATTSPLVTFVGSSLPTGFGVGSSLLGSVVTAINGNTISINNNIASVQVPAGLISGVDGKDTPDFPLGLTFTGRAWSEHKLLRLAYAYEQATNLRKPPPNLPAL